MKVDPGSEWVCNQCEASVRIVVSVSDNVVTFRKIEDEKNKLHEMNQGLFLITHKLKKDGPQTAL
jgi:hypothetical protein